MGVFTNFGRLLFFADASTGCRMNNDATSLHMCQPVKPLISLDRARICWYLSCVFGRDDLIYLVREFFRLLQARSSAGERYLDTVEVGGSTPPAPTNFVLKAKSRRPTVPDWLAFTFYQGI